MFGGSSPPLAPSVVPGSFGWVDCPISGALRAREVTCDAWRTSGKLRAPPAMENQVNAANMVNEVSEASEASEVIAVTAVMTG